MTGYLELMKRTEATAKKAKEANKALGVEEPPAPVVNINTARAKSWGEDERRLLVAGWEPKERCGPLGLTIWANPATGFYCSKEVALHRLMQRSGRPDLEASDIPSSSVMRKLRASVKMAQGEK